MRFSFLAFFAFFTIASANADAPIYFEGYGEATRTDSACLYAATHAFVGLSNECGKHFAHCDRVIRRVIAKSDGFCRVYMVISGTN